MRYKSTIILVILGFVIATNASQILDIQKTNYTLRNVSVTYESSTTYSSLGMAPLYTITNAVLDIIVGKNLLPEGLYYYLII